MKKIALILLICVYALSSFGIGIKQFYCCGKLKSTNISFIQDSKQKCNEGDKKGNCCKTEFKSFKVKDSHIAADDIINPVKHFTELHLFTASSEVAAITKGIKGIANATHAPPLGFDRPIYILNCIYRI